MSHLQEGDLALITGAASGIGLAVAHTLAKKGVNLALIDNNQELLDRVKKDLPEAEIYQVDVSKSEQWQDLKGKILERFDGHAPTFLMLNAGIGLKGDWGDDAYFQNIIGVNLMGQVNGLNTFLPLMRFQGDKPSTIIMTGSKQGITNPPGNPAYNASKSAVKTLAEHLHYDLRSTSINVHLLVPGWTFTGLSGNIPGSASNKEKPPGAWSPEQVSDFMFSKLPRGKDGFWIICPDNDVTEDKDRRRMLWTAGDAVYGRPPLSRWREETKGEAEDWMSNLQF